MLTQKHGDRHRFQLAVEVQRMILAFVMAALGYALMLVAMTYVVVLCRHSPCLTCRDISSRSVQVSLSVNSYLGGSIVRNTMDLVTKAVYDV